MSRHEPIRPAWRCAACDDDWPCARRRAELVVECHGSRVMVALVMARYFSAAVEDCPTTPAAVLYLRFLGWFRAQDRRDHDLTVLKQRRS